MKILHDLAQAKLDNRFQNQPWYIRMWRRRHYLSVPHNAFLLWLNTKDDEDNYFNSFKDCWGLATSFSHSKMGWWYTFDEVFDRLDAEVEKDETNDSEE